MDGYGEGKGTLMRGGCPVRESEAVWWMEGNDRKRFRRVNGKEKDPDYQ